MYGCKEFLVEPKINSSPKELKTKPYGLNGRPLSRGDFQTCLELAQPSLTEGLLLCVLCQGKKTVQP